MKSTSNSLARRVVFAAALAWSVALAAAPPEYPLKASANGRYLVDQHDAPVLLMGDSPQALMVNLTTNEAAMFFTDRAALGFNTVWINLLCANYTGGREDASTRDGLRPFTGKIAGTSHYDLTLPDEGYFARTDTMLRLAAQQGIQVLLDPCETGSFLVVMAVNGVDKCRAYGRSLGDRYKDFPNIIWMSGNDFQDWRNPASDAVVRAVALGIRDRDTNHLHTTELDYIVSSSLDDATWKPLLGLNATYTYHPTYARLRQDYQRPNFLPTFMVEANYEFESLQGPVTTAPILRKQEYWTMTSGACGQLYGNRYTWPFLSGWQDHLDTPGAIQFGIHQRFFEARAWFDLVPDTNHAVLISNYGAFNADGWVASNDYATAARTPDGRLAIIYTPVLRPMSVDLSKLAGPLVTRWFDPANGSFVPVPGSPFANSGVHEFTPPGNNSDGDGGWVVVLETNPPPDPPPPPPAPKTPKSVQHHFSTPQTPQSQLSVAYASSQTAGNANILAIGWNDTVAGISSVSDSAGNAYHEAVPLFRGNGLSQAIYYATDIQAGVNTVTVIFDRPAVFVDLRVAEYSGLAAVDVFDAGASASGNSGSASSGPVSTGSTNELLFAAGMTATTFTAPGDGFTERLITSPDADIVEDRLAGKPGSYVATAPLSSGAWLMQVAAFRAAPLSPQLSIRKTSDDSGVVAWPVSAAGYGLQQSLEVTGPDWADVNTAPTPVDGENQLVISFTADQQFFRLRRSEAAGQTAMDVARMAATHVRRP